MALPVALIPVAISAIRSLVLLNRKVGRIATLARLDEDVPVFLPKVPDNIIRHSDDRRRMEEAFSGDTPERQALQQRGLAHLFDQYADKDDPLPDEQRRMLFFRFLNVFYQIEDAAGATGQAEPGDASGLDSFLVRSARLGQGSTGLRILRATAETLVDFLGENATVFLARSNHGAVLSTILREFAAETDLEEDNPERIIKVLLGSVALAATDESQTLSDEPLALLLFASLGQVRRDMGEDFVAGIISRDGFDAVVSDWLTRLANDDLLVELVADIRGLEGSDYDPSRPETLPARLQPVYGVLSETLKVIGSRVKPGDALSGEEALRAVFGAVLDGLSNHSAALLADELAGKELMAQVLNATLTQLAGHPAIRSDALAAPVFAAGLNALAQALPRIGPDDALSKAETLVRDLALAVASDPFQEAMSRITQKRGARFADALAAELVNALAHRAAYLSEDIGGHGRFVLQSVLSAAPDLLDRGLNRETLTAIFSDTVALIYPADTPEGSFTAEVLPLILPLFDGMGDAAARLGPDGVEAILRSYITHLGTNRPVWQEVFERGLIAEIITAIAGGIRDADTPVRLPPDTIVGLVSAALVATGRNALDIAEVPDDPALAKAAIRDLIRRDTRRAIDRAVARLGRGAGTEDLPDLVEAALDLLFSAADGAPVTDQDIDRLLAIQTAPPTTGVTP